MLQRTQKRLGIFLCFLVYSFFFPAFCPYAKTICLSSSFGGFLQVVDNNQFAAQRDSLNADSVMKRVFSYTKNYGLRAAPFQSEVYVRHTLSTKRRNVFTRYMPDMMRLERGTNEYFGEKLSRFQFTPPSEIYRKDLAGFSTMPYLKLERDAWIGRYSLSIYEPNIFTDRILSPINRRNRLFYRYKYISSYTHRGERIVNIRVKPKISNTQLVRGTVSVCETTGRVEAFSFFFNYGWSRIHVSGEMGREGQASLLPNRLLLVSNLRFLGNHIDEAFEVNASYNAAPANLPSDTLKGLQRFNLTRLYQLHTDTTRMRRDKAYFDLHRPYPLQDKQQAIYNRALRQDSIKNISQAADTLGFDTLGTSHRHWLSDATEDLLFDSHTLPLASNAEIKLPALLTPSMLQWSHAKGLTLQTRVKFHANFTRQRTLDFSPRVGYNFKEKQFYWKLPLTLNVLTHHDGQFTLEASGGEHIYNARQADEVRRRLHGITNYDSLINAFNRYDLSYYRDNRLLATFSFSPFVGLRLNVGWRLHRRTLLQWNEVAASNGMARTLTGFAPRLSVSWTPALYYYREHGRAIPLRSKWPTFMVDYERGLSTFNRSTSYERIESDIQYTLPLYALRAIYLRGGVGLFTKRGSDCFLDYDYFRSNHLMSNWHDELSGEFQLLDSRWYNESRHYARLSAAYESPMLFLSRLRWLTRVIQKERLYINLLNVGTLGYYSEWGYGLSTPLLDVAGFVAVAGHSQTGVGVKFVLRLGD